MCEERGCVRDRVLLWWVNPRQSRGRSAMTSSLRYELCVSPSLQCRTYRRGTRTSFIWSIYLSVDLSIYIYLSVDLSIDIYLRGVGEHLSIYLSIYLSLHTSERWVSSSSSVAIGVGGRLFVCLSVYLYLSICRSIFLSIYLSVDLSIETYLRGVGEQQQQRSDSRGRQAIYLSFCLSISIYLSICLFVYLYLFVCLSIYRDIPPRGG